MNAVKSGNYEEDLNSLAKLERAKADGLLTWKIARDKLNLVFLNFIPIKFIYGPCFLFDLIDITAVVIAILLCC